MTRGTGKKRSEAAARDNAREDPAQALEHARLVQELEVQRAELQAQNVALIDAQRLLEDSRDRYSDLFDFAPVAYFTLDAQGIVRNLNLTAASFIGVTRQHAIGLPFANLVLPEHQAGFWDHVARCRSGSPRLTTDLELRLRSRPGAVAVQLVTAPPLRSGAGEFRTAVLDMSDRQLAEERRIELAREQARREESERSNRAKDEFFSHLAHELRTPLNAVHGWTHLLSTGGLSPAETRHAIDVIWRNVQAQIALINEMLDMSRIIRGGLELRLQEVEIADLVRTAIDAFRPQARDQGITLECRIDPLVRRIDGDPDRLYQVITNLLSNAVKFTPAGGTVSAALDISVCTAEAAAGTECARLVVRDSGPGIPDDERLHVFEPFRSGRARDRTHSGLGLGLTIVRRLVELHGGSVRVSAAGPSNGSEFVVELPLEQRTMHVRPGVPDARLRMDGPRRLDDVRVLVVDDHDEARTLVRRILEPLGARVTTAPNAADALEKLRRLRPHVLVSDIAMPGEDGVSLIRRVRALPAEEGGDTPAIALTAFAGAGEEDRVVAAGFQTFVAKPADEQTLAGIIDNLAFPSRSRN